MPLPAEFIEQVRAEIAECKQSLEMFTSGKMHLYEGPSGTSLTETTHQHTEHLRSTLEMYEKIVADYEAGLSS